MFDFILEPLSFVFMQKALVVAVAISIVCGFLSCYLVLKGWSLMGDAISHAVLPGVVLAYVFSIPLSFGAFLAGIFCVFGIGFIKENSRLKEDTIMGIVFSAMFAFGILLYTKVKSEYHLDHILFGNILGITNENLVQTLIICGAVFVVLMLKRKDFLIYCFDYVGTKVAGINVKFIHFLMLGVLALCIVAALQAVGIILVVAMLVTPGIIAFSLSKDFSKMILIAIFSSSLASFIGVILSYHLDAATGASIVLTQSSFFIIALFYIKLKGKLLYQKPKILS